MSALPLTRLDAPPAGALPGLRLADGRWLQVEADGASLDLRVDATIAAVFGISESSDGARAALSGTLPAGLPPESLLPLLAALFCPRPRLRTVELAPGGGRAFAVAAVRLGIATEAVDGGRLRVERGTFWQHPALWLRTPGSGGVALDYVMTDGRRHPRRAPRPRGEVYRRRLRALGMQISLRVADVERDLDRLHGWFNQPRVDRFWEMAGSRDDHAAYLQRQLDDPKALPLIAEFDGDAFGYFELYWAREDRIAPYYDADDFDRGCHVLIGNPRHFGPAKVTAWMRSVCHYAFLDDPRTQRFVGEPRVDNTRFIDYLQSTGFARLKEFDFPHKRAAMMMLEREAFFGQHGPWAS